MTGRARAVLYALIPGPATGLTLMERTGRTGLIYYTCRRLVRDGYVTMQERYEHLAITVARGGRPRFYYRLTEKGFEWLKSRNI